MLLGKGGTSLLIADSDDEWEGRLPPLAHILYIILKIHPSPLPSIFSCHQPFYFARLQLYSSSFSVSLNDEEFSFQTNFKIQCMLRQTGD